MEDNYNIDSRISLSCTALLIPGEKGPGLSTIVAYHCCWVELLAFVSTLYLQIFGTFIFKVSSFDCPMHGLYPLTGNMSIFLVVCCLILNQVSKTRYMKGRLTLDKVNSAINDMATYAEANAQLITAPRKKVSSCLFHSHKTLLDCVNQSFYFLLALITICFFYYFLFMKLADDILEKALVSKLKIASSGFNRYGD